MCFGVHQPERERVEPIRHRPWSNSYQRRLVLEYNSPEVGFRRSVRRTLALLHWPGPIDAENDRKRVIATIETANKLKMIEEKTLKLNTERQ